MSRHLISNSPYERPDAVTVVGWDHELRTYFCDVEHLGGVKQPFAGGIRREIADADELTAFLASFDIYLPAVLVARLRLEKLALSSANAPHLDWRSGEPVPLT